MELYLRTHLNAQIPVGLIAEMFEHCTGEARVRARNVQNFDDLQNLT